MSHKNQSAERTLSVIATVILVLGIILGVITMIGGFVAYSDYSSMRSSMGGYGEFNDTSALALSSAISSIIWSAVVIIASLFQWAIIKVFVNISLNTTSLDNRLEKIENKLHQ